MTIKRILPPVLIFAFVGLSFFLSIILFGEAGRSLSARSSFLSAPLLAAGADIDRHDGEIVWLEGALAAKTAGDPLFAPLSETRCLYYRSEKWEGGWEEDSDGDTQRVWNLVQTDVKSVPLVLSLGTRRVAVSTARVTFENLELRKEYVRRIDSGDYKFREYVIPIGSEAWVLGRLERGEIKPPGQETIVSLRSANPVVWRLLGEPAFHGFFAALCALVGFFVGGGYGARLIGKFRVYIIPRAVLLLFGATIYFWVAAGGMFYSLGEVSPWPGVIVGIVSSFVFVPPLMVAAGHGKPFLVPLVLVPGLVLAGAGAWLMYNSFFPLGAGFPRLIAGLLLFAAAPALYLGFDRLAGRMTLRSVRPGRGVRLGERVRL